MFSLRRIKSETSLSRSTPAGHIGHVNLTTQDVSSLLSRMARLESELKEASSPAHQKQIITALSSTSISSFRDDSQILRQADCVDQALAQSLLSLPFMKTIVDIAKRHEELGLKNSLEDELIISLTDAIQDTSSPWSKLVPRSPVVGPRTQDHYISAIDMVITARKEVQNGKRFAKYWKSLALQATMEDADIPLTPSPSDISDTGLSETLSPLRDDRMKELIAKRNTIISEDILQPSILDSHYCSRVNDNIAYTHTLETQTQSEPNSFAFSNSSSDKRQISSSLENAIANDVDQTLVDIIASPSAGHGTKHTPSLTGQKVLKSTPTKSPLRNSKLPRHSPAKKQLVPRGSHIQHESTPSISHRTSIVTLTSVQAKRSMYESLAASSPPTSGGALRASSTFTSRLKMDSKGCAPSLAMTSGSNIPRRMPLKPVYSPRALAPSQKTIHQTTLRKQLGVTSTGTSRRNSQLKSLILSQTHRSLESTAHVVTKRSTYIQLRA